MRQPSVSIVIPLHVDGEVFRRDVQTFAELDYPGEVQLVIVSDRPVDVPAPAELVLTGRTVTSPAEKRDAAAPHLRGDLVAYIDDDARPDPMWLARAARHFEAADVGAVGGPGLTPPEDDFWQRAGGAVYASPLGSGPVRYRFAPCAPRLVDDYPAYNLVVRRTALDQVGGWRSTFYGGEDTKLCLALVQAGWKIAYDPEVVVYHHRRALFRRHLKQIWNVGVHRGHFVRAFPETSRRSSYFMPTAVVAGGTFGLGLALWAGWIAPVDLARVSPAAWVAVSLTCLPAARWSLPVALVAGLGVFATHVSYAAGFLRGLTLRELHR